MFGRTKVRSPATAACESDFSVTLILLPTFPYFAAEVFEPNLPSVAALTKTKRAEGGQSE
jgi:hypothetical protein